MLLAVDIGNTNVTVGVFEGEELRGTWRLGTDIERVMDEYAILLLGLLGTGNITRDDITDCVISSTVPSLTPTFQDLVKRYFGAHSLVVGSGVRTGVRILYDNPRDVGPDRIIDALAAMRMYGPPPLIICDCGTATVFDAVSREGDYVGGAIAPGIGLSAETLFARASKLYRVELVRPPAAIGKNTVHALQAGILLGYVGLVEGLVARFKRELGADSRVIGTGGWAGTIARETNVFDVIDPNLTLHGLRFIHEVNAAKEA
jgi:type III pantothenate kinase